MEDLEATLDIDNNDQTTTTSITMDREKMHCILEANEKLGGLYLGGVAGAENPDFYKKYGITCVLECAAGLSVQYPKEFLEKHLLIPVHDYPDFEIKRHFEKAIEYIDTNRKTGASVYVHCAAGVSRSATFVIAYLMKTMKMNVEDALKYVKARRQVVRPNEGFLKQLKEYEKRALGIKGKTISKW